MSYKYPTEHEKRQLSRFCPKCGVDPGEWCVTDRGSVTVYLHVPR